MRGLVVLVVLVCVIILLTFLLVTVAQDSPPSGAWFSGFILPELVLGCVEMEGKQSSSTIMLLTVPLGLDFSDLF